MPVNRPFYRTCRQFSNGGYSESGRWRYLLHTDFAKDPQHYVRAFLLLQQDLEELFAYVEPAETNLNTYSHRIQQLLMRACVEIEANLTAILVENGYAKKGNLKMEDYRKVERSHRLSAYKVRIPGWKGNGNIREPFANWQKVNKSLPWYQAYNKSKHNRHEFFSMSTFEALTDAMCGLIVVLSAQFYNENYSPAAKSLDLGSSYSYGTDDEMQSAIGDFFRVKFPIDWPAEERYDFEWSKLENLENPFERFVH